MDIKDLSKSVNNDNIDKNWSVLAMFIVRDQENLKKDFDNYKSLNDDKISKLVSLILEKYSKNKEDIAVIQVKVALIASFITFILTIVSGVTIYLLREEILKWLGMV